MWEDVFRTQFAKLNHVFSGQSSRVTEFDLNLIKALGKPAPTDIRWKSKVRLLFYPCKGDVPKHQFPVELEWFDNAHIYRK